MFNEIFDTGFTHTKTSIIMAMVTGVNLYVHFNMTRQNPIIGNMAGIIGCVAGLIAIYNGIIGIVDKRQSIRERSKNRKRKG